MKGELIKRHRDLGFGLKVLSDQAMAESGANRREGKNYNEALSRLQKANPPLDKTSANLRADAIWLAEPWDIAEPFILSLDDDRLQRIGTNGVRLTLSARTRVRVSIPRMYGHPGRRASCSSCASWCMACVRHSAG